MIKTFQTCRLHTVCIQYILGILILSTLTPFISTYEYEIVLRDNTPENTVLSQHVEPVHGERYTYSLLRSRASGYFRVDNQTGQIITRRGVDRDSLCPEAGICCRAEDRFSPIHSFNLCSNEHHRNIAINCAFNLSISVVATGESLPDVRDVTIVICEENDHIPEFIDPSNNKLLSYPINVSESVPIGHRLRLPLAHDPDASPYNVQHYRLQQLHIPDIRFAVDPFELEVITVGENRDIANSANRGPVYGSHQKEEGIVALELKVMQPLDREETQKFSYRLLAIDGGIPARTGTLLLHITILDTNDHAPVFSQTVYEVDIDEGITDKELIRLQTTDADEGQNALIRYRFLDQTDWNPIVPIGDISGAVSQKDSLISTSPSHWFRLDRKTGSIHLQRPLDYETKHQHRFLVLAYNPQADDAFARTMIENKRMTATATVIVNVRNRDDEAPQIIIDYASNQNNRYKEIKENGQPSHFVAFVTVFDPDVSGKTDGRVFNSLPTDDKRIAASKSTVSCRLGSHEESYRLQFNKLFESTRKIKVRYSLVTRKALDREAGPENRVEIVCQDSGSPPQNATAEVQVKILDENDNRPILKVLSIDPSSQYHLKLEAPQTMEEIRESSSYTQSSLSVIAMYAAVVPVYTVHLEENQPIGTVIAQIQATDADSGENGLVTFYLPEGSLLVDTSKEHVKESDNKDFSEVSNKIGIPGNTKSLDYVQIDRVSGKLSTTRSIDREGDPNLLHHLFILVRAADHGKTVQHSAFVLLNVVILDVNDNPPVFVDPFLHFTIHENLPAPSIVGEIRLIDPDLQTVNDNSQLGTLSSVFNHKEKNVNSYSSNRNHPNLRIDPGPGNRELPFLIHRTKTGRFFINTTRSLDRESEEAFQFKLIATDGNTQQLGGNTELKKPTIVHTTSASVSIIVLDVNDNPPGIIFPNPRTSNSTVHRISYMEPAGYEIISVNANDPDASEANGRVYFELTTDKRGSDLFMIDRTTGLLRTRRRMTANDAMDYDLKIIVRDGGSPPLETHLELRLVVDTSEPHRRNRPVTLMDEPLSSSGLTKGLSASYGEGSVGKHGNNIKWDSVTRGMVQVDIIVIIVITIIAILLLLVIICVFCFYSRRKRGMSFIFPSLCFSSNASQEIGAPSDINPSHIDRSSHKNNMRLKSQCPNFYSFVMGNQVVEENLPLSFDYGHYISPNTPRGHPRHVTSTNTASNSTYTTRKPSLQSVPHTSSSFLPSAVNSCGTPAILPYRTNAPIIIPDVVNQSGHGLMQRLEYADYQQTYPVPERLLHTPKMKGCEKQAGNLPHQVHTGYYTNQAKKTHGLWRGNTISADGNATPTSTAAFRPIRDDFHLYQRIQPESQHFDNADDWTTTAAPSMECSTPNAMTMWRSYPSLYQGQTIATTTYEDRQMMSNVGYTDLSNKNGFEEPLKISNFKQQQRTPTHYLASEAAARHVNPLQAELHTAAGISPSGDNRLVDNYAISFPQIQTSFV